MKESKILADAIETLNIHVPALWMSNALIDARLKKITPDAETQKLLNDPYVQSVTNREIQDGIRFSKNTIEILMHTAQLTEVTEADNTTSKVFRRRGSNTDIVIELKPKPKNS